MTNEILNDLLKKFLEGRLERTQPIAAEIKIMLEKAYELGYESGLSKGAEIVGEKND